MDKATRNTLRSAVTDMRRILENSVSRELEGQYGIYESGKIDDISLLRQLDEEGRDNRERLLVHLEHIQAAGLKPDDAVDQLKREIAFTHLNRLAAFKLMEARGLIREAVTRSTDSQGFQFYLADDEESERLYDTGDQDIAYRRFLLWQASQFDDEISVLFSPLDSANFIFPPHRVLEQILDLLNSDELADIWDADETIGWIYQYFTPKELRDKARKESQAPRNSYELAFRNQFYTPRYVVEFLTDNTLGRTWYEMHQGDTILVENCQYLVRRPNEIFMTEGEEAPEMGETSHLSQEELLQEPVYIPYRAYKDPRMLNILDPACGSAHFLLYCFDLLVLIYEEAWQRKLSDSIGKFNLSEDYDTLDDLRRDIPRLILRHNLHGIDIDRRATQIAALALWLKAQRYYNDHDIKSNDRPKITQGNIVLAEPMPGDKTLLKEFAATLNPPVLGQLVERVFDKMQLAGEAGSLLKIEEAIQEDIAQAKKLWETGPTPQQMVLFPDLVTKEEYKQRSLFDVSAIDDAQFWGQAEKQVLEALEDYSQQATNTNGLQRRLFAQDAAAGFAFIEVLRKRFDVVLMNPPFGDPTFASLDYFRSNFQIASDNLLIAFQLRFYALLDRNGSLGAITDRSFINKKYYKGFRKNFILDKQTLEILVDLGWGVLDAANVEVAMYVHSHDNSIGCFSNLSEITEKVESLKNISSFKLHKLNTFKKFPHSAIAYDLDEALVKTFDRGVNLSEKAFKSFGGLKAGSSDHLFRLVWEVPISKISPNEDWVLFQNGSPFTPYYYGCNMVVRCDASRWETVMSYTSSRITNSDRYFERGLAYGKRTDYMYAYVMRANQVPSMEGHAIFPVDNMSLWMVLLIVNSAPYQELVNHLCGQHKYAGYVNTAHLEIDKYPDRVEDLQSLFHEIEEMDSGNEISLVFIRPQIFDFLSNIPLSEALKNLQQYRDNLSVRVNQFRTSYDHLVQMAINWKVDLENYGRQVNYTRILFSHDNTLQLEVQNIISYIVGSVIGRWDIRYATGKEIVPKLPDPFDALSTCPLGMLQDYKGLPASKTPIGYPLEIDWDGIMVDDEDHPDDIVRRVRAVLHLLWGDNAGKIETEILDILAVESLRQYFQAYSNSGFWMNHVSRYTRSGRKAPIYWYLRSSNGNYGLWFYYHRLDSDFYYKAVVNYVEPRVQRAENRLDDLKTQQLAAGSAGSEAKRLADEVEKQEDLVAELRDFHDKLKVAADLRLNPDLNDGVVLNIAPLHELVPWKEAPKYWKELLDGKYEWSSIGQQLREKGMVQ